MAQDLNSGQILIYQTEDGHTRIDVRLQDETLFAARNFVCGQPSG